MQARINKREEINCMWKGFKSVILKFADVVCGKAQEKNGNEQASEMKK